MNDATFLHLKQKAAQAPYRMALAELLSILLLMGTGTLPDALFQTSSLQTLILVRQIRIGWSSSL